MTRPLSRTRAREVDEIVAGILDTMARGQWVTGVSHRELAQRHGVSVSRVEDWATEAGRALRLLMLIDRDTMRARVAAHHESLAVEAHQAGEYRAAVAAREAQAKLLGLNAPEKHQHAHVVATYEQLPPQDRLAQVREAIAALEAERDALERECNSVAIVVDGGGDG